MLQDDQTMYAVTDIETTGLDPWKAEILTISTIIASKDFEILKTFNGKIKPENNHWSKEAEEVHKISMEEAETFNKREDVLEDYVEFLSEAPPYAFVCHALPVKSSIDLFDRNFIFAWFWVCERRSDYYFLFPENRMVSTIRKKRKEAQELWGLKSQKLSSWMDKLGIDQSLHHDAEFDAKVCLEILKYQNQGDLHGNKNKEFDVFK